MFVVMSCFVFKASNKISGMHFYLFIIKMLSQLEFNVELPSTCLMGGMSWLPNGTGLPRPQLLTSVVWKIGLQKEIKLS